MHEFGIFTFAKVTDAAAIYLWNFRQQEQLLHCIDFFLYEQLNSKFSNISIHNDQQLISDLNWYI